MNYHPLTSGREALPARKNSTSKRGDIIVYEKRASRECSTSRQPTLSCRSLARSGPLTLPSLPHSLPTLDLPLHISPSIFFSASCTNSPQSPAIWLSERGEFFCAKKETESGQRSCRYMLGYKIIDRRGKLLNISLI